GQTLASGKRSRSAIGTVLANHDVTSTRSSHIGTRVTGNDRSATMTSKIFAKWDETHSDLWGHQPIRLEHEMHKSPAFSTEAIEKLIENYPCEGYSLVKTGAKGPGRVWREGEIGNLSGRQVIEAISRGGLWLNMRDVGSVDPRFHHLVGQMFD